MRKARAILRVQRDTPPPTDSEYQAVAGVVYSLSQGLRIILARMMPALPGYLRLQRRQRRLIVIDSIPSTIPARHGDHDSGPRRKLSTIRPYTRPRRAGMTVHDALESLYLISRNNHFVRRSQKNL
jgi:hypothetical protein